jgi:hypothetical protein
MKTATTLAVLVGALLPAAALAQEGPISRSYTLTVRAADITAFEEAYLRHVDWHRQQNDSWTWTMWSSDTGDLGRYIVISGGHTWTDFDSPPVDEAADGADALARFGGYLTSVSSGLARIMADVSRPAADPVPMVHVIEYELKAGKEGDFLQVVGKFKEAADQASWPLHYLWVDMVSSGGGADYALVLQHESWASFAPQEMSPTAVLENAFGRQEAQSLLDMFTGTIETSSERVWTLRPDLTYTPGN